MYISLSRSVTHYPAMVARTKCDNKGNTWISFLIMSIQGSSSPGRPDARFHESSGLPPFSADSEPMMSHAVPHQGSSVQCFPSVTLSLFPFPQKQVRLSLPHPLDGLRNTNVVGLKLVQANADGQRGEVEPPPEEPTEVGPGLLRNVVDDDLLEAHVGVQQDGAAEDGVEGGVERAGGEGGDGEGDEAGGEQALGGPVVGALGGVGRRDGGRVVDCEEGLVSVWRRGM